MIELIKFDDIVKMMESCDGRDRVVAEYIRLKQWYESIKAFNNKVEARRYYECPVITPDTKIPYELSRELQSNIGHLLHIIEVAAVIEDIDLEGAIRRLINKSLWAEDQCENAACECKTTEEIEREKTCCQKDCAPPCEEGIYNPLVELPEGIIPYDECIHMLDAAIDCELHAGDQPCVKENCTVWRGDKCLWGELELYESALYHLKKNAEHK